jgi:uncharacterized tellurite resistance protein B-like protein
MAMIAKLKAMLSMNEPTAEAGRHGTDEVQLATAALMVEAARLDSDFDEKERRAIETLLTERFDLDEEEVTYLIEAATIAADESNQLYGFARNIKDQFSSEERIQMIEMLWEVAYADGVLHDYEASLLRRVAGLIYVPDRDSGLARKRVLERLSVTD